MEKSSKLLTVFGIISAITCILSLGFSGIICVCYGIILTNGTMLGVGIVQICLLFLMTMVIFVMNDKN